MSVSRALALPCLAAWQCLSTLYLQSFSSAVRHALAGANRSRERAPCAYLHAGHLPPGPAGIKENGWCAADRAIRCPSNEANGEADVIDGEADCLEGEANGLEGDADVIGGVVIIIVMTSLL